VRISRRIRPLEPTSMAPVVRYAKKWKPDTVVISQASCWGAYSEMLALANRKIPYICISQLNTPFSWPGDALYEAVGEAFAQAQTAVFVSQGNLDLFQNQVARRLINATVIYNPPSIDVTEPCGPPPTDVFHLLNVARIDPAQKGQDIILGVLALPKWRDRKVLLEIAGGGNRRWLERLIEMKGLIGSVRLLGHSSNLTEVWQRATYGVFPSRYEGMPLAMIEGMALGRSVVATNVAGHGEWIEDRRNGFLADGAEVGAFDKSLENAWINRGHANEMGVAARETANRLLKVPSGQRLALEVERSF
jgi:glycosyltransferase involved in cell wall biosynthesis